MVKAMKDMLYSTIGNRLVDVDVFATKITEASGIINSRPPTYIGKNDYSTPEQLLKGGFTNKTLDSMEPDVTDEIDEQNAHVNQESKKDENLWPSIGRHLTHYS